MRRDREFWQQAISELKGGETIAVVARRHGVRAKTLAWWKWKLGSERMRSPQLLPVVVRQAEARASAMSIELRVGEVRVLIESGTDVKYVADLVSALQGAC
jgi:transposase-like protein